MVLFNYSTKELTAKIVYYGPGLCGKTTNLQFIFESLPDDKRGRMLSLSTQTDRTLYFDLLPMDLGDIHGMRTRIQLYTVPGQVFYNQTRKMVLKGVDGVVFVADSQTQMADANLESFRNLLENLEEHGVDPATIPTVLQFNKRDLPSILTVEEMNAALNRFNAPFYEAIATTGIGVHDTLKAISKLVLRALSRKSNAEETAPPAKEQAPLAVDTPVTPEPLAVGPTTEPSPPPAPMSAEPAAWNDDSLDDQLDQMDAAEIEGLLQEVDGFDLEADGLDELPTPAAASSADLPADVNDAEAPGAPVFDQTNDPLGNSNGDEFSLGASDPGPGFDQPATDISLATVGDDPPAPARADPGPAVGLISPADGLPDREDSGSVRAVDGASGLSLESFLATTDDLATPKSSQASVELTDGGSVQVPISMNIDGRTVRYVLTLRLEPEDLAPRR